MNGERVDQRFDRLTALKVLLLGLGVKTCLSGIASNGRRSTRRVTTHSPGLLRAPVHSGHPSAADRNTAKPLSLQAFEPKNGFGQL